MSDHDHDPELGSTQAQVHTDRKSGRAVIDDDGRSVWEWQTATGVFTRDVTDDQLSMLSTVELEIDETPRQAENAKVFTATRYPTLPVKRSSRGSANTKKAARGVVAWLRLGWLG